MAIDGRATLKYWSQPDRLVLLDHAEQQEAERRSSG